MDRIHLSSIGCDMILRKLLPLDGPIEIDPSYCYHWTDTEVEQQRKTESNQRTNGQGQEEVGGYRTTTTATGTGREPI